jgi:hypothetical protein
VTSDAPSSEKKKGRGGKRWYVTTEVQAMMLLYAEISKEPALWADAEVSAFRRKALALTQERVKELEAKLPGGITGKEHKELRHLEKYVKKPYVRDIESLHRKFVSVKSDYGRDGNLKTTRESFLAATTSMIHVGEKKNDEQVTALTQQSGGGGALDVIASAIKARASVLAVSPDRKKRRKITEALGQIASLDEGDVSDDIKESKELLLRAFSASLKTLSESVTTPLN